MSKCDVYLTNYHEHYKAGDTIVGFVQCTFANEKTVKGITVSFRGTAKTKWSETKSHYNSTTKKTESKTVYYYGEQLYFEQTQSLLHNIDTNATIPAGVYTYPFSFVLPANLPSTFHPSDYGRIKYTVKATVQRHFLKCDYDALAEFKLISPIDLNSNPNLREAVNIRKQKDLCFCCRSKGTITFELNVPYTGFCEGQSVPIYLNIENMANASITDVKYKIKKTVTFHSQTPSHHTRTLTAEICQKKFSGVGAHGERVYEETIDVPVFDAPNLTSCSIITVHYTLEVKAYLPCPHRNITAEIPIVIGQVPLTGMNLCRPLPSYNSLEAAAAEFGPPDRQPLVPSAPSGPPPILQPPLVGWSDPRMSPMDDINSQAPPPTYDEATSMFKR